MYFTLVSLLLHTVECANILGIFPIPSISHQVVFQPLWRELSLRGHKVTVVTPNPLNDPLLTNLTEISIEETYELLQGDKVQRIGSKDASVFQTLPATFRFFDVLIESGLNSTQFRELIGDRNKTFDFILAEFFLPVWEALSERYDASIVTVASVTALTAHYTLVGSPNHPVLYPDFFLSSSNEELLFWEKIRNVLFSTFSMFYHFYSFVPRADKMAEIYFGRNISHKRNLSMLYVNENLFLNPARPHVPAVIKMGQMHLKPAKLLPKDLQQVLDQATEGVVYFSLGSNVKSIYVGEDLQNVIIQTFSELPYKVIWKWETDYLPNKPPNVIIRKWLPQQDLLAHPNVRVFVTQGGLQSTEEAIDKKVPMVGLPFMYDQPTNMQKVAALGIGITLNPATVTKDELKNAIIDVAENSMYKKRIKEVRRILFDTHAKGVDNTIWWFEYVIRHKGAKHLRSPSAEITSIEYLMLDVIIVFVTTITVITYGTCKLIKQFQKKD